MLDKLKKIEAEIEKSIEKVKTLKDLELLQIKYLGRKGQLTLILRGLSKLKAEERPRVGSQANLLKKKIEDLLKNKIELIEREEKEGKLRTEALDLTLPGTGVKRGKLHPITLVMEEIKGIFQAMGYTVAEGPDIETDYYNFEALNIPKDHPARDMWSTLYVTDEILLRTHTSPVQVRVMEKQKPPVSIIAPGRVYRRDMDISHSPVFHQIEGLLVDKGITFADLKGTLTAFLHQFFGKERRVRFRPSYFPFTEPSAEVDVECIMCGGQGCRVCKGTGWLEILGAGMVDPAVFKVVGYDPEEFTGFAFGMGIERIAMLKYGIDDIRLFFENDLRFLRQF